MLYVWNVFNNTKIYICDICLQIGLNDINILIVKNGKIHSKKNKKNIYYMFLMKKKQYI